jgi:hypothetical protein
MKRSDAVKQAMQSMEIEDFIFNQTDKDIFKKLANGEIDHQKIRNLAASKVTKWKRESPESFYSTK